jgi:hypothetical protein
MASPPSINKVLVLILTPFVTCILGNQEPWFVIPIFFPLFLIELKRLGKELKSVGWWLVALSGSYFIAMGCIDSCRTLLMWDAHPKPNIMPKVLWFLHK